MDTPIATTSSGAEPPAAGSPPPGRVDRLLFPAPQDPRFPASLRNVTRCALLRLPDGSVRFLRTTGVPWTTERLDAVEQLLIRLDDGSPPVPELARRIGYETGVPGLALGNPPLDGVDPSAWDLSRAAVAAVARNLCLDPGSRDPARASTEVRSLAQCFVTELEPALAAFVAALDPEARAVATRHDRLDVGLYNFLARRPHRAWRLQFAATFPILLRAAASGPRSSSGAQIRALVDAGMPLIRALAARWAVSPGTLRSLVGRGVDHVGARWQDRPHLLARILDALRPEDRPGDDPAAWKRLAEAVDAAEEIFRRPVASSPLTLGWLRGAARHGFAQLDASRRSNRLPAAAVPQIDALRTALVEEIACIAATGDAIDLGELRVAAATIADRELSALAPARLAASARKFALDYAPRRAALDATIRRADGRTFWPLLPRDFVSTTGCRRVTPLATRREVRAEGKAQALCIQGGAELAQMTRACAEGRTYLLSIRDAVTGAPLSTAEVGVVRGTVVGKPALRVRQHKAHGNAPPSRACVAALREALAWAAEREVQDHLEEVLRQARRFRTATPGTLADLDFTATREALRVALGDRMYASLARTAADLAAARRLYGGP